MTSQFKTILQNNQINDCFDDLDNLTISEIKNNFYYRYCCANDERFLLFFKRSISQYKKQYYNYLRIENINFDPMVSKYLEKKFEDKITKNDSKHKSGSYSDSGGNTYTNISTNEGTILHELEDELHKNETNTITATSQKSGSDVINSSGEKDLSISKTDHINNSTDVDTTNTTKNVVSNFPQANIGNDLGSIGDLSLTVEYASNMTLQQNKIGTNTSNIQTNTSSETDNETNSNTNTTTYGSLVSDHTVNGGSGETTSKSTNTQTNDTIDKTNASGTSNLTGTNTNDETNSINELSTHKEIYSGREESPQEMLEVARKFILNSNALIWFLGKLDDCFMSNLFYEEGLL